MNDGLVDELVDELLELSPPCHRCTLLVTRFLFLRAEEVSFLNARGGMGAVEVSSREPVPQRFFKYSIISIIAKRLCCAVVNVNS